VIPTDFLDLASQLVAIGTEAAFRTAVSRAYYSAFHAAVSLIKEAGVSLPVGPESHQKVRFCLMESGEAAALQAGDSLQILRHDRNQTDYDMDKSERFNEKLSRQRIERARAIFDLLQQCRQDPASGRFRDRLRDYAANVLRLPIVNN
jgi:uncharacterized protein (UPF0332 family)